MSPGRREVPDALVWVVLATFVACPVVVWLGGVGSSFITGQTGPMIGLEEATRAVPRLFADPSDPEAAFGTPAASGPLAFWATTGTVGSVACLVAVAAVRRLLRPGGRPGMARRSDLRDMSPRVVAAQVGRLRPDLGRHLPEADALAAAGVALGRHHPSGARLFGTIEHSFAVVAPPRTGKTGRMLIPTVLDHDGPAVVTSTRWEIVEATAAARAERGPVWVFDADQAWPRPLPPPGTAVSWSPVAGCSDPQTAMIRARSLARAAGAGSGIESREFWTAHATTVLQSYLHAAAVGGRSIGDVRRWALDTTNGDAETLLRSSGTASTWASDLAARTRLSSRQRDGIWGVVQQSLKALDDPRLLQRCTPPDGEGFDPSDLLDRCGTLYVVGRAETQDVVAPLVAALVEAVTSEARSRAARSRGGRLCPPLLCALDEVANIAPLPTLPTLVADGGGSGITTVVVLQSRAQARQRWGEDGADAILAACTHRLVFGGGGELRELDDLARLIGERDDEVRSHQWQTLGTGSSTSTAVRRVPIITPADLQAMPKGRGVLCSPNAPPAEVTLDAWWERPDASRLRDDQTRAQAALQQDNGSGDEPGHDDDRQGDDP